MAKAQVKSASSHSARNHNPHQNCLKLYFSTLQETCQIQKRQSNYKIAFNISKLLSKSIFVNLPTQELPKVTGADASVASMDKNLAIEQSHFFLNQRSAVNDVNFQQTLQREALELTRLEISKIVFRR